MSAKVALVAQKDYEIHALVPSLKRAIALSGFDMGSVAGKNVLLKPNMLGAYPPESGVDTRPEFVEAAARIFMEAGAQVSIGDSASGVHPIENVWRVSGMREVCRRTGAREVRFEAAGNMERNGILISKSVADADIVINLPKFKTHSLTVMTLAVKNLFGCVNGMQKTGHHREHPKTADFSDMLVRIAEAVGPDLSIVDGIIAMEGDGPSGGRLKGLGVIAAGRNMYAVDAVCSRIAGLEPGEVDTLSSAMKLGLFDEKEKIEVVGASIDEFCNAPFAMPATVTRGMRNWWLTKFVLKHIWSSLYAKPRIVAGKCRLCGDCANICPAGAISFANDKRPPEVLLNLCIQCYCCHEVCPHRAIVLKRSPAANAVRALVAVRRAFYNWRRR